MRIATVPLVGAGLGALVGGVLGRAAMYGIALLNPEATGRLSDDGFVMGRFTLAGSLSLVAVGAFLGLLGGVIYVVVRGLLFGPGWFRVVCVGLGAGVPVGNQVVHVDGVDFTLLQPVWLSVALFVAIPGLYGVLLTLVAERRLLWRWPVGGAPRGRLVVMSLWGARAAALALGSASLVELVGKVRELS
ncbi:hypothetical protein NPS01_21750 [Nocardioides psychrotolerans]|uniref:Uncharacterized protein n=1 Tax=Nocardioides psychrotolerans TaxID=1005945 RepID=A0A1I3KM91_9ACTN|nr:hypothetical protein [Nocardioides psychrotolerans]GEP38512.1 hypothetical protein NPS01_21750 [Nocardioides psychrotolerans]SFI73275.1 hypothetical protein SAMN05216561_11280 [Nocardioides psychrotolerans]